MFVRVRGWYGAAWEEFCANWSRLHPAAVLGAFGGGGEALARANLHSLERRQLQWQHNMVSSKMASTWAGIPGTETDLSTFAGCNGVELIGVDVPDGIETLLRMEEEEDVVYYISEHMPLSLMESFEDIIFEVQQAANHLSSLRRSLEADDVAGVLQAIEESEAQPSTCIQALRVSAEHAALEVSRLKKCHNSWRSVTEARIHRLEHAKDEAEKATQDYLAIEAKLNSFRGIVSEKSRACLMGVVLGSSKGMIATCYAAWRGATEEGKVHRKLRETYEAQIEDMQRQILQYQATGQETLRSVFQSSPEAERLRNVRNAMARRLQLGTLHLLERKTNGVFMANLFPRLFQCWITDTQQSKRRGQGERELDKAS
ncbi:unnamed protein product [Cladocopium goreaui]|uniref:Uncharacterized protein n=1 Tax=Cladocopium goreaui TaxID=2562237 RepID=A0A9P1DSD2_9DINO|nr:unnamed protein product [Cladocopium goreaui]